jgi:hypothetical protein
MMRKKDRKWLEEIQRATDAPPGMYAGMSVALLPHTVARRLGAFIISSAPHNPIHKDRWVISEAGRKALAQQ